MGIPLQTHCKICPRCGKATTNATILFCPRCGREYQTGFDELEQTQPVLYPIPEDFAINSSHLASYREPGHRKYAETWETALTAQEAGSGKSPARSRGWFSALVRRMTIRR